jgi:flagellar basal body-associated protein FliL
MRCSSSKLVPVVIVVVVVVAAAAAAVIVAVVVVIIDEKDNGDKSRLSKVLKVGRNFKLRTLLQNLGKSLKRSLSG